MIKLAACLLLMMFTGSCFADVTPWQAAPRYWSLNGKPVILAGGSDDDNLFQWPAERLTPHLDRLHQAGGNLVRNTMSARPDKGFEVYPYLRLSSGKYDLDQWNPAYWARFDRFLAETAKRGIVVQIELWDRFDFSDHGQIKHWQAHPYNPKNNINYTRWQAGLATEYKEHPGKNRQPFFFSTPGQSNNRLLLAYQKRYIDEVLHRTLKYGHVLYCIDNETKADEAWSSYWAGYIKQQAANANKRIYVTEMLDERSMDMSVHGRTIAHPERYDFIEVSQNNHNDGRAHWQNLLKVRRALDDSPRPMNSIKVYGASQSKYGDAKNALDRFWRNILTGVSAVRFHRPDSGIGLNDQAVSTLTALRALERKISLLTLQPLDVPVLSGEAYLSKVAGGYLVYLPDGQAVISLDLPAVKTASGRWFDLQSGSWMDGLWRLNGTVLELNAPAPRQWIFHMRTSN